MGSPQQLDIVMPKLISNRRQDEKANEVHSMEDENLARRTVKCRMTIWLTAYKIGKIEKSAKMVDKYCEDDYTVDI